MSQKSLTEVATNRLVIVFSECLSVRPARSLKNMLEEFVRWHCKRWWLCLIEPDVGMG